MSDNTRCPDPQCSCQHEDPETTVGLGVPTSRAAAAMDAWLARVDLVLAAEEVAAAA